MTRILMWNLEYLYEQYLNFAQREKKRLPLLKSETAWLYYWRFEMIQIHYFLRNLLLENSEEFTYKLSAYLNWKIRYYRLVKEYQNEEKEYKTTRLEISSFNFTMSILSDNEELIQEYATFSPVWDDIGTFRHNLVILMQKLVQERYDELDEELEFYKKITEKKRKNDKPIVMVIEWFKEKDESKINEWIVWLLLLSWKREHISTWIFTDFIDIEATVLAKLAVRAWYEITVEHELLPSKLLPIKPLEEYPQYEFLDEWDKERWVFKQ